MKRYEKIEQPVFFFCYAHQTVVLPAQRGFYPEENAGFSKPKLPKFIEKSTERIQLHDTMIRRLKLNPS